MTTQQTWIAVGVAFQAWFIAVCEAVYINRLCDQLDKVIKYAHSQQR